MTFFALLTSIPSPSSGSLHLGPLRLNAYGLMIALGVVAAVKLTGRRAEKIGVGNTDDISSIAMWAVPAGVIGGRVYHVLTDYQKFQGHWFDIVKIWQGGLGIWGGITLGVLVGAWRARVAGLNVPLILSAAMPGIAVAQAIGRWGNWFNQELFGRATTLPWALRVSASTARNAGEVAGTTFHPTFLYESLGCLLLAWLLIRIEKTLHPLPGRLVAWYAIGYTVMRFFIEGLRIDPAHHVGGLRLNQWVSVAVGGLAIIYLIIDSRRSHREPPASTVFEYE